MSFRLWYTARTKLPEESLLSCGKLFSQRGDMATCEGKTVPQITIGNSGTALMQLAEDMPDGPDSLGLSGKISNY